MEPSNAFARVLDELWRNPGYRVPEPCRGQHRIFTIVSSRAFAICCSAITRGTGMAIGEFGGAPNAPDEGGLLMSAPLYWFYEMSQVALNPSRALADATKLLFRNPLNPLAPTTFGKSIAAACEVFERSTRRYGRPEWDIHDTLVGGERVPVNIETPWQRPFCRLLHFARVFERAPQRPQPRLLVVAPLSGHFATLLRGTVEALL